MKRSRSGVVFAGVWGKKKVCACCCTVIHSHKLHISLQTLAAPRLGISKLAAHPPPFGFFPSPPWSLSRLSSLLVPFPLIVAALVRFHPLFFSQRPLALGANTPCTPPRLCVVVCLYSEMKSTRSTTPRSGFFCRGLQDDLIVGNVRDGHFRYTARRTHTLVVHTHITSTGTVHVGYPTPCRALVN